MNVGKISLTGIMVLMMAVSPNLAVAQTRAPAQNRSPIYDEAFGISADFKGFGRDYILPTSHHNFSEMADGERESGHFQSALDAKLYQTSNRLKTILNRSINYLNNNENKMNTPEYQNVKNIASRLLKFARLEMRLRDDGCLNSSDETVRRLARNVLYGSIYSPMPDCAGATGLGNFGVEMSNILRCLNTQGRCTPKAYNNRGLYAVDTLKKREMLGKMLDIKKESDTISKATSEFGLSGRCSSSSEVCQAVQESVPNDGGHNPRTKADSINRHIAQINQTLKEVPPGRTTSAERQIIAIDRAKNDLAQGPLRFAGLDAIRKCLPKHFETLSVRTEEALNSKGLFNVRQIPDQLRYISEIDMKCLNDETLGQQAAVQKKKMEHYEDQMDALNKLGYIADRTANEMIDDFIVSDPLAFGGYLMRDAPLEQLDSVCETIVMISHKMKRDARIKSAFLAAIDIAESVLLGAAMVAAIMGGPVVWLAVGGIAISAVDGAAYSYLEGKYEKKGAVDDVTTTQFRSRRTQSEEVYRAFQGEMDHRLHLLSEQEKAEFWKYFAFGSAGLGVAGVAAMGAAKTIREGESAYNAGSSIMQGIAKGGARGKSAADNVITLVRHGKGAIDKVEMLRKSEAEAEKFLEMMAKIKQWQSMQRVGRGAQRAARAADRFAHTAHHNLHTAETFTAPAELTTSLYWAKEYSVEALKAIESLLLLAKAEQNLPQQGNYQELDRWISNGQ